MAKVEVTQIEQHGIPAGVKLTPMMRQYVAAKQRYPEALLFFRMGDFYEMFFRDAELGGEHLELTVTSRDKESSVPAPMSGFPHHQLSNYLARALAANFKVAICEQLEDPTMVKGIVKRGITRVVTPGVVLEGESLDARANNFLVALVPGKGASYGLACIDISTGEFRVTEVVGESALRCEVSRLEPRELLLPPEDGGAVDALHNRIERVTLSTPGASFFELTAAKEALVGLVGPEGGAAIDSLESFGFCDVTAIFRAAGAVASYIVDTQSSLPAHTRLVTPYRTHETLILDETAKANLELFRTLMDGRKRGSLLGILDKASTAMGGRRIRHWMAYPLVLPAAIEARLDAVEWLRDDDARRGRLREVLGQMYDVERLNARIAAGSAGPRELWFLRLTLERIPPLLAELADATPLMNVLGDMDPLVDVAELIASTLADEPSVQLRDGGVIRPGFSAELDELVSFATSGKDHILALEHREREMTGIQSLKVRYNRVFGYYIDVRKTQIDRVPDHYIRKQTLTNSERYYTAELKEFEEKVLNAESQRGALESELFGALRDAIAAIAARIAHTAGLLADLDALTALAEIAHQNNYCRPVVDDGDVIELMGSRHPVVEQAVGREDFVPNDIQLDRANQSLIVLTGPNMAGKSTVMRQVALATLMAQMGSFVPATSARIGVVDRIFTRVGAADDLASGRSTFMVEMHETATILREATARSLLILDEIGRGTSTFDGVSIAWAVAEYIHDVVGAKTLFATHYHELTEMAKVKPRVRNYTIAVKEWNDEVIFLRQLVEGGANRSYGIQVARLAGLPNAVINRSKEVLDSLQGAEAEEAGQTPRGDGDLVNLPEFNLQLSLFSPPPVPAAPSAVEMTLSAANLEQMTPLQALNFLYALRERLN